MFPYSERVAFKTNTLAEVVCQLRFPPILKIAQEPVGFQERIRQVYTGYQKETPVIQGQDIPDEVVQRLGFQFGFDPVHVFSTPEELPRQVKISKDSLTIIDFQYKDWDSFLEQFLKVEEAFRDEYKPPHYTRVGLLYRNIIDPTQIGLSGSPNWSELLNPQLLGLLSSKDLSHKIRRSVSETTLELEDEARSMLKLDHGLVHKAQTNREVVGYMICGDFFVNRKVMPNDFRPLLDLYNKEMGNLFRWAIAEPLREALGVQ